MGTTISETPTTHLTLPRRMLALIAAVAVAVRLGPILINGQLTGMLEYDDGVYYSASTHLIRGLLPYRDFIFVHPPGVVAFLTPFAALGGVTTDGVGMAVARLVICALAAVSACLIAVLLERYGNQAALFGGLLYATWGAAAAAERTVLLEPFLTVLTLSALVVLQRAAGRPRLILLAGAAIGLALGFKLWAIAPLIVIAVMVAVRHGWQRALIFVGGAAGGAALLALPFFVAAPAAMWRDVVAFQLGRPAEGVGLAARIEGFDGDAWPRTLDPLTPSLFWYLVGAAAIAVLLSPLLVAALHRTPFARWGDDVWWSALFGVEIAMLVAAPTFYYHYAAFAAPMICLLAGRGVARLVQFSGSRRSLTGVIYGFLACVLLVLGFSAVRLVGPGAADLGRLKSLVADSDCVWTSAPTELIALDAETDQIDRGCPMSVDPFAEMVAGASGTGSSTADATYRRSATWQQKIRDQWQVSDLLLITQEDRQRFAPATEQMLTSNFTQVDQEGPFVVWRRT